MRTGRGRLIAYVGAVELAAAALLVWALPRVNLWHALVAAAAVLVSEAFASTFREDVDVSLANVVLLVVLMVGGPELTIVSTLGAFPMFLRRATQMRAIRVPFNVAQYAIAAALAAAVFEVLSQLTAAVFVDWGFLVAVASASVVYSLTNHALVAGAVSLSTSERFLAAFRSVGTSIALQAPYVGIAVLAVVIIETASPWALLFMAVPTLVARYGLLAFQKLDEAYDRLVRSFVKAIEIKDLYTRGHSERVAQLSVLVAEELGVPYEQRRLTRYAALLHDVGKIGVPGCILNKPGPLTDDEFEEIKKHPTIGAEILHDIDFLTPAIDIVRYHHERLDGRGYPHGVSAEALSDIVRIVTAVDAFDAMTSTRSYRKALPVADAVAELRRCAGRQFDPRMVEALATVVDRVGWEPTIEFASEERLHGREIPVVGTAQERLAFEADHSAAQVPR